MFDIKQSGLKNEHLYRIIIDMDKDGIETRGILCTKVQLNELYSKCRAILKDDRNE